MPDPHSPIGPTRLLLAAALGLAILLVCGLVAAEPPPAGSAVDARAMLERSQAAIGTRLRDHRLVDVNESPVSLSTFRGKPLIVSFVYTGCFQVCPTTVQFLDRAVREAQRALGPGSFNVVTVGFNQPFDTPSAMRDFQRRHGIDAPGWHFLAGDEASIGALAADVGFTWVRSGSGFDHVIQATLVGSDGRVVRQVYGESFELPMLIAPLKDLVLGQNAPIVDFAGLADRVRILCTIYDPRMGRYRLDYALLMELVVGVSMVLAVAWFFGAEWRRQRAQRVGAG